MTTTTPEEQADDLVEGFELFDTWDDRYRFLIDLGRKLPPLTETEKSEVNRVHGCQSNVWIATRPQPETPEPVINFVGDSDSSLVKGLIAVLWRVCSGQPAEKIVSYDVEGLLDRLGLSQHLTMGRRNGLDEMVKRVKALAAKAESRNQ